jgi:hypothetical protein
MGNGEEKTGKREFSPLFTFTFFLHLSISTRLKENTRNFLMERTFTN